MAINTATPVYGTNEPAQMAAVVDVDINQPNVNRPERTSAKAQAVVVVAAGGGAAGAGFITVGPPLAEPANNGGTITAGGVSQQFMASNATRKGWAVQNQSSDYLYVRSRGVAGTTDATQDQNSIRIAPGQEYVADYISVNAQAIIGPTTGQAYWAREW